MLKQHKNALLDVITEAGYNPKLFQAEDEKLPIKTSFDTDVSDVVSIKIKDSPLKFSINTSSDDFYVFKVKYTLFTPRYPEMPWSSPMDINELLKEFRFWLEVYVGKFIQEQELPDLWAQLETYKSFANESDITEESTSDFSEEEKENLRNSIKTFESLVEENFNPNNEQTEFINEQLDYLSNALERLNRFDWRGVAISTLLSIAVNLSVDTEKGRLLFGLFQQAFESIHGLLQ